MFSLSKQVLLLSFSSSIALDQTKCLFLNDETCMIRPTLIDLNSVKLKDYPFMISLDKYSGSCNILSPKIWKGINVKAFNMITNNTEAKAITKHISCDCKCKFNSTTCNSNQKWNNKTCQCECKSYRTCKKDYSWYPGTCICDICKYLKSTADTPLTEFDEIIIVMDNVSTKKTNAIVTNVTSCL